MGCLGSNEEGSGPPVSINERQTPRLTDSGVRYVSILELDSSGDVTGDVLAEETG